MLRQGDQGKPCIFETPLDLLKDKLGPADALDFLQQLRVLIFLTHVDRILGFHLAQIFNRLQCLNGFLLLGETSSLISQCFQVEFYVIHVSRDHYGHTQRLTTWHLSQIARLDIQGLLYRVSKVYLNRLKLVVDGLDELTLILDRCWQPFETFHDEGQMVMLAHVVTHRLFACDEIGQWLDYSMHVLVHLVEDLGEGVIIVDVTKVGFNELFEIFLLHLVLFDKIVLVLHLIGVDLTLFTNFFCNGLVIISGHGIFL